MADVQQMVGQINQIENQTGEQAHRQTDQEKGLWTIPKLMKRYGIGKDRLYKRMAYLKITPWNMGNCFYLDDEQLAYMDGLEDHIQRTGRMILLQKLRGMMT